MNILAISLLALVNAQQFMSPQELLFASNNAYNRSSEEIRIEVDNWIEQLSKCESGGDEKALNPKDTDGTPSKGKFQFKDTTFNWLSKKYDIPTTSIWNGDEQEQIVRRMIYDRDLDIRKQFPACTTNPKTKNYAGLPPTEIYSGNSS